MTSELDDIPNGVYTGDGSDVGGLEDEFVVESCADWLSRGSTSDGTYLIDPDGVGGGDAFEVYCDMTSDGGGWTRIEYASDFPHGYHGVGSAGGWFDTWLLNEGDFNLVLTTEQIQAIQVVSTEGKQTYVGTCEGVLHWFYNGDGSYGYAAGFRFLNGEETPRGQDWCTSLGICIVSEDGCAANGGDDQTVWEISDVRVPIVRIQTRDNGASGELFGSPLTQNPAWLR